MFSRMILVKMDRNIYKQFSYSIMPVNIGAHVFICVTKNELFVVFFDRLNCSLSFFFFIYFIFWLKYVFIKISNRSTRQFQNTIWRSHTFPLQLCWYSKFKCCFIRIKEELNWTTICFNFIHTIFKPLIN